MSVLWDAIPNTSRAYVITLRVDMALNMAQPPTYAALVHTTSLGEIELVYLLDNNTLVSTPIPVEQVPGWLRDAVALLRYCERGALETEQVSGYKYTEFMVAVCITHKQYNNLLKGA